MKSFLLVATVLSALSISAHAQGIGNQYTPNSGSGGIGVASDSTALSASQSAAASASRAASRATGGAATASTGPVTAAGGSSVNRVSTGSNTSNTSTNVSVSGVGAGVSGTAYRLPYEAPATAMGSIYNGSSCSGGGVVGQTSFPVGAFGLGINNMDLSCQVERAHGDAEARAVLCIQKEDYRKARKQLALQRLEAPCYDDVQEVTQELARQDAAAPTSTPVAYSVSATAPTIPVYCSSYGYGAVAPKECSAHK